MAVGLYCRECGDSQGMREAAGPVHQRYQQHCPEIGGGCPYGGPGAFDGYGEGIWCPAPADDGPGEEDPGYPMFRAAGGLLYISGRVLLLWQIRRHDDDPELRRLF